MDSNTLLCLQSTSGWIFFLFHHNTFDEILILITFRGPSSLIYGWQAGELELMIFKVPSNLKWSVILTACLLLLSSYVPAVSASQETLASVTLNWSYFLDHSWNSCPCLGTAVFAMDVILFCSNKLKMHTLH